MPLDIGIAIPRLVPTGGLEDHAIRTMAALRARQHRVTLYTAKGAELAPAGVETVTVESGGWTNHGTVAAFASALARAARDRHDVLAGFKKMPGLDVLFCADWRYADPNRSWLTRMLPRYRTFAAMERACFGPESRTRLLLLAGPQRDAYAELYPEAAARMSVLPPTIDRSHNAAAPPSAAERAQLRAARGLAGPGPVWLWVGLQPQVKGLDRAFAALAAHPGATLLVCSASADNRRVAALIGKAQAAGTADRIKVLGRVSGAELQALFKLSDLLVHPARLDVTGTVILEAMAHALPVIATGVCGYAAHVAAAGAGIVLPEPFRQDDLDRALGAAGPRERQEWSRNAFAYCADPALYSGIGRACDLIEAAAGPNSSK